MVFQENGRFSMTVSLLSIVILSLKFVNFRSRKKDTYVNTKKCMPSHLYDFPE